MRKGRRPGIRVAKISGTELAIKVGEESFSFAWSGEPLAETFKYVFERFQESLGVR